MKISNLQCVLVPILICTIHKYLWNICVPGIVLERVTDVIPVLMQFLTWGGEEEIDMQADK